jgi:S1-C subfamily serine protease
MSLPTIARCARAIGTIVVIATAAGCAADPPAGVVGLTVTGCSTGEAHGSGIVMAPGLVLTAAHVVKGADEINVTDGDHSTTASVVAFDPDMDLAYVRLDDGLPGSTIELADSVVERGERGVAYVFRDGHVVALPVVVRRPVQIKTEDIYIEGDTNRPGFELDADIEAGDSGGPVLVDGKVVGVLWARSSKYEHRAYAIDPVAAGGLVREQLSAGAIDNSIDLARCT